MRRGSYTAQDSLVQKNNLNDVAIVFWTKSGFDFGCQLNVGDRQNFQQSPTDRLFNYEND
jgi:hypothetical protein